MSTPIKETTLGKIEKLAEEVAVKAASKDTDLQAQIEALKVLGPYYLALKKAQPQGDSDSPDEPTMAALQDRLHQAEQEKPNGRTVSRSHRRGGRSLGEPN